MVRGTYNGPLTVWDECGAMNQTQPSRQTWLNWMLATWSLLQVCCGKCAAASCAGLKRGEGSVVATRAKCEMKRIGERVITLKCHMSPTCPTFHTLLDIGITFILFVKIQPARDKIRLYKDHI